jgi:glycosyltransferase involved in cell wall biosynthesis
VKIAYFSPLPPKRSGIATYSKHLVPVLAQFAEIELFDDGKTDSLGLPVNDYVKIPSHLAKLDEFDVCIYHLGNSPHYHFAIREVLLGRPGIVVLHDAVLYYLMAGRGPGGLLREMQSCSSDPFTCLSHSFAAIEEASNGDIFRHPHPESYPLLRSVLAHARMIIVHGETALLKVREAGYEGPVRIIPHLIYPDSVEEIKGVDRLETRAELGVEPNDFLIGSFGFLAHTKRLAVLFKAVAELVERGFPVKLLVVGIGDDISDFVDRYELEGSVIAPGFVNDAKFQCFMAAVDAVVNLRYPCFGEASGALMQGLFHGKPCVVSDIGWFAEFPDEVVKKVSHGRTEVSEVVDALSTWMLSPDIAQSMGATARSYVHEENHPSTIARLYLEACNELIPTR